MKSGFLSSFVLLKKVHLHVRELMDNLTRTLFTWNKPTDRLFITLNETVLSVDSHMLKIHKNRFTLWNYLEYREKLLLIRELLAYARQMNGFDFNEHNLIETVFQFLKFALKNEQNLRAGDTLRKFMIGKAIMSHGGQQ